MTDAKQPAGGGATEETSPGGSSDPAGRGRVMSVRLSDGDWSAIAEAAKVVGAKPSTFARAAALGAAEAAHSAPQARNGNAPKAMPASPTVTLALAAVAPGALSNLPQVDELKRLRTAINRIGGLLNQLVAKVNRAGIIPTLKGRHGNDSIEGFIDIFAALLAAITEVKELLSRPSGTVLTTDTVAARPSDEAGARLVQQLVSGAANREGVDR